MLFLFPLLRPVKKVKFFIYSAIFLKIETEHFYMFTNNN